MLPADNLAIDAAGLDGLKRMAREQSPEALHRATQQFEALFLQMVMKAMREASPQDGIMDSNTTRMYRDMLDQQLAQTLSQRGATGLAAMMERQLTPTPSNPGAALKPLDQTPGYGGYAVRPGTRPDAVSYGIAAPPEITARPLPDDAAAATGGDGKLPQQVRDFVAKVWPHAVNAAGATGIPAQFLIAHAALETGWGKGEIRLPDGRSSYNLFNIKAGSNWKGATVDVATTEYVNGQPVRSVERFRAYGSYGEAFSDYANLLRSNPRYSNVLNQTDPAGFARGLQNSGYATDPMYADKLQRIIGGNLLRVGLSG